MGQLAEESYVINLARSVHLVEVDLLAALDSGQLKGVMLDVFSKEPFPGNSPLWTHPRVAITLDVAAVTRPDEAMAYIAKTITQLENGETVSGEISLQHGYSAESPAFARLITNVLAGGLKIVMDYWYP